MRILVCWLHPMPNIPVRNCGNDSSKENNSKIAKKTQLFKIAREDGEKVLWGGVGR